MTRTGDNFDLQRALDGNSVAGLLRELFGMEMTTNSAECAQCGTESFLGATLAFGREMGTVLRCPGCGEVVMRIAERPDGILLDMRGVSLLRIAL